jgi:acetolactate synthase-1/2/3 large subunit
MRTVAHAIAARLAEARITHIFGVPGGGSNLDLIDAAERAGIRFVLTATETGAAIAALAQAEVSGRAGACLTTLGPGAASVVNGVACAHLDRAPLLVFTDSHGPSTTTEHQRIDQRALFTPVTKASFRVTPEHASDLIGEALGIALAPPRGPVHIECRGDVLSGGDARRPGMPTVVSPRSSGGGALDSKFAALLERSRRPVLLAGLDARSADAAAAIGRLCDHKGIPALVTYKAKGVVPDSHAWFAGVFTNGAIERDIVGAADLLIAAGLDPVELIPRPWTYTAPIVSCAPWRLDSCHVPFAAHCEAPVDEGIGLVEERLARSEWNASEVAEALSTVRSRLDAAALNGPRHGVPVNGFSPAEVVRAAVRGLPPDVRVTVDAGAHMFPITMGWPIGRPNGLLISNGLSTMGFALPAALGAALLDPRRPVVALTGDGGLMMCLAELATAARERLKVIVLLFADKTLSLIDIKQQHRQLPARGVHLGRLSWPSIAEGLGAAAFVARTPGELESALARALDVDGPALVEATVDPGSYARVLTIIRGSS